MLYTRPFLALALANFCISSSGGAFFLFPLFVLDRGGSAADIGVVMGAFALASILCRPGVAAGIDRLGRKRAFAFGALLMALLPIAYLPLSGPLEGFYPVLLALRLAHGVGCGLCFTAAFTWAADLVPAGRLNEGIGMFGISGLAGMAAGPLLGEAALHRAGFPGLFVAAGALGGLSLLLHLRLPEPFRLPAAAGGVSFRGLLRLPRVRTAALLGLLFGFGLAAPENFIAPLAETRGIPLVSPFFLAYTAAAILTRLPGGRLGDRVGEGRILPWALLLTGGGLAAVVLARGTAALAAVGFLCGCGHGLLFPSLSALALRGRPAEARGRATAIYTGAIDGGVFAGSLLLGWIGELAGLPALFLAAGAALLLGLALLPATRSRDSS